MRGAAALTSYQFLGFVRLRLLRRKLLQWLPFLSVFLGVISIPQLMLG